MIIRRRRRRRRRRRKEEGREGTKEIYAKEETAGMDPSRGDSFDDGVMEMLLNDNIFGVLALLWSFDAVPRRMTDRVALCICIGRMGQLHHDRGRLSRNRFHPVGVGKA